MTVGAAGALRPLVEEVMGVAWGGVVSVEALEDVMRGPLRRPRFAAATLLCLSLVALLLAGLGVHGVLAVIVDERRRDLGIRVALGAGVLDVGRHLAQHLVWIGLAGAALGVGATLWGIGIVEAQLHAGAPAALDLVALVVAATAALVALAGILPLVHAVRCDPLQALRAE